jgi:hypothetical protein
MPSRKKAQGQARKVEKERQAREQARARQRASCKHSTILENATQEDIDAAESLLRYHVQKWNAIRDRGVDDFEAISKLVDETHLKYFEFDDATKQVFRELILSQGTTQCVKEANETDLTEKHAM